MSDITIDLIQTSLVEVDIVQAPDIVFEFVGSGSGGGSSASMNQVTPSATWTFNHNLGYYPNITVVNNDGDEIEAAVNHVSATQVVITFAVAVSGSAYAS